MTLLLLATALLVVWVLAALWVNCGESLLETMAELLGAAVFCLAFAVFIGWMTYVATYALLTVSHSDSRLAAEAPHAHPK